MSNWQTHKARSQSGFVKVSSVKKAFLMSIKVCDYKYGSRGWEMGPVCWWPALLVRAWDRHNGKCHQMSQSQSDQLYQGSGDKSLRAKAGAKCWLFTAGCISKLAVCPLSNVKLDLIQGSCTSSTRLWGGRHCHCSLKNVWVDQASVSSSARPVSPSLSLVCYYPTGSDKNSELEPRAQVKTLAWAESAEYRAGPASPELTGLKA